MSASKIIKSNDFILRMLNINLSNVQQKIQRTYKLRYKIFGNDKNRAYFCNGHPLISIEQKQFT